MVLPESIAFWIAWSIVAVVVGLRAEVGGARPVLRRVPGDGGRLLHGQRPGHAGDVAERRVRDEIGDGAASFGPSGVGRVADRLGVAHAGDIAGEEEGVVDDRGPGVRASRSPQVGVQKGKHPHAPRVDHGRHHVAARHAPDAEAPALVDQAEPVLILKR